jgi:integrase
MSTAHRHIAIEARSEHLRLRWRYEKVTYTLSLGLRDTPSNRATAQLKADIIIRDMEYSMFDSTLVKYRGEGVAVYGLKTVDIWQRFIEHKRGKIRRQTITKYEGLLTSLREHFRERVAVRLSDDDCQRFKAFLGKKLDSSSTQREQLSLLNSGWEWAVKTKLVGFNPWKETYKEVGRAPVPPPDPFSPDEMRQIIQGFRTSPGFSYYSDFVEFLLGTGARIGEVCALTWADVQEDCTRVWFGKTLALDGISGLKAGEAGHVPMSSGLSDMLRKRRPANAAPGDIVFPAMQGGHIDKHNFRNRAWKSVLKDLNVRYRKPYTTRKSLITYWLSKGEDPLIVAKLTRTSLRMLYKHYAGFIPTPTKLPNLIDDLFKPTS